MTHLPVKSYEHAKTQISEYFKHHFEHYGYKKTTVEEIAAEMQISKKTIYKHFRSIQAIFDYIVMKSAEQTRNRAVAALENTPAFREKIAAVIRVYIVETGREIHANPASNFFNPYDVSRSVLREVNNLLLVELIKGGINPGEFRKIPVTIVVLMITVILSEIDKVLMIDPESPVDDIVIKSIIKILA